MKTDDIISELFSLLKNQNEEERLFTLVNILNDFYTFDNEYQELSNIPKRTIQRYLEIIIMLVNGNTNYRTPEEAVEAFCYNMSDINYIVFRKRLFQYKVNIIKENFKLDDKTIQKLGAMILVLSVAASSLTAYINYNKEEVVPEEPLKSYTENISLAEEPTIKADARIEELLHLAEENEKKKLMEEKEFVELPLTHEQDEVVEEEPIVIEESPESQKIIIDETQSAPVKTAMSLEETKPQEVYYETKKTDETINYILDKYNITYEQFNTVVAITRAESDATYDDAYAVINTMGNRLESEAWRYTAKYCYYTEDENHNKVRLVLDGTNIYDIATSPNQFIVYENGRYKEYLNITEGPVFNAVVDYLTTRERMHNYTYFLAHGVTTPEPSESFSNLGNNYYHVQPEDDRIYEEGRTQ